MFKVKGDYFMKKIMLVVIVTLFAISMAFAPFAVAGPQQDKMTACNKEAAEKKLTGEERNKFMSDCLKTKPVRGGGDTVKPRGPHTPPIMSDDEEEKIEACNKEANEKKLKGAERQKFMKECFEAKTADTPQQEKMKACNKEANDKKLKGEARKKFMKECLKTKPALTPQQEKMKACNKEANEKKLKGEARKKFMSECLKAKPADAKKQ
jgi:hypothetical protein